MKKNRSGKGLKLTENKLFFSLFLMILSLILFLNATYAWTSFAKWRRNHMQGNEEIIVPSALIEGKLDGVVLNPGQLTQREVIVTNTSLKPVVIRVKLTEILALLEIDTTDQTGNGHLAEYQDLGSKSLLKVDVPGSWKAMNYFSTNGQAPFYQVAGIATYPYLNSQTGRPSEFAPISFTWGAIKDTNSSEDDFWLYQEQAGVGYFYYSDLLEKGESTTVLIDEMQVSNEAPNSFKGALHRLDVQAEAGEASKGVYGAWNIQETVDNPVYQRFEQILSGH